jgi:hypothetical protein
MHLYPDPGVARETWSDWNTDATRSISTTQSPDPPSIALRPLSLACLKTEPKIPHPLLGFTRSPPPRRACDVVGAAARGVPGGARLRIPSEGRRRQRGRGCRWGPGDEHALGGQPALPCERGRLDGAVRPARRARLRPRPSRLPQLRVRPLPHPRRGSRSRRGHPGRKGQGRRHAHRVRAAGNFSRALPHAGICSLPP